MCIAKVVARGGAVLQNRAVDDQLLSALFLRASARTVRNTRTKRPTRETHQTASCWGRPCRNVKVARPRAAREGEVVPARALVLELWSVRSAWVCAPCCSRVGLGLRAAGALAHVVCEPSCRSTTRCRSHTRGIGSCRACASVRVDLASNDLRLPSREHHAQVRTTGRLHDS